MTAGWAVAWRGKSCTVFLMPDGGWSLDPAEAQFFTTWVHARVAAGITRGISVVRCWCEAA
jgi:hypothetical protein